MAYFAVRVQRSDRQKPCNTVIETNTPAGAERGIQAAYGDRIGRVISIKMISLLDILGDIGQHGDVRGEDGEIVMLPRDPRFAAVGEHIYLFRTKFRSPSSHATPGAEWDQIIPVSANNEDCAWAIYGRLVRETAARTEIVTVRDFGKLAGIKTIHDKLDTERAGWGQSYTETPDDIAQGINFKTHYAFHNPFMSWDRMADLWQTWFDDRGVREKGQRLTLPQPPKGLTAERINEIISAALPKDCPSAVMGFAFDLRDKLVAEASKA
jgi:hypothetical protein